MNRNEFLKKLKENLLLSLDKSQITKELDYYDKYISDEISKGRTEKEVLDELGDPMLIAKTIKTVEGSDTIIDSNDDNYNSANGNTNSSGGSSANEKSNRSYVYTSNVGVIGCVIFMLIAFIIIVSILNFLGYVAIGATGLLFGMGPFGIIMLLLIIWIIFGNRR